MKAKIPLFREVVLTHIVLALPVRYETEDMPADFPLREGDMWRATVELDTGKILNWPIGRKGEFHMKVVDEGTYILKAGDEEIAIREGNYVPHGIVPGEYGDYVEFIINEHGVITNWPKTPTIDDFFPE